MSGNGNEHEKAGPEEPEENSDKPAPVDLEESGGKKVKYALVFTEIDNLLLDNFDRKLQTYLKIGWDEASARAFISEKSNYNKIASFNTSTVSFSASSRRNRYYEIYNSDEMLAHDAPYQGAVEVFNALKDRFHLVVFTKRDEDLAEKTLATMKRLGFGVDDGVEFLFKGRYENPHKFRNATLITVRTKYQTGIAVTHLPEEITVISQFNFTPVGFSSTHEVHEFQGASAVCQNWEHVKQVLDSVQ
ncbi:MAG: hypothetical protein ACTSU5_12535 [Promethearchaeota archaeon]